MLILLLPILASVLVFITNQRYIRQEIIRTNETQLDLTQQTIDKRFDELQRLGQQLSLNSRLARFATIRGEIRPSHRMNLYFLTQDMVGYSAANDFIDELFVYFEGTDSVVGPSKHLQDELFYRLYIGPAGMSEATWRSLTSQQHYANLINVDENPDSRQLLYLHNIEQVGTGSRQIFLSLVDKNEFTWATRHSPDPDTSVTLLILGADDEVLVRQGLLEPTEEELQTLLQHLNLV